MTLVEDVLGWIEANYPGGFPSDLERINRDDSEILEGSIRAREAELQDANYVGVASASTGTSPLGFGYNQLREPILSIRIEALHEDEYGHIASASAFDQLVDDVETSIQTEREFPTTSTAADYHTLFTQNFAPQSSNYRDYFRTDFEVRFRGYKDLP